MGTRVVPSYANIFMGKFEKRFITSNQKFSLKIMVNKRFIDDLFLLWRGNEQEAKDFVEEINQNDWGITLTPKFDKIKMDFLDIVISQVEKTF